MKHGRRNMPKGKSEYIHFKWRLKDRYDLKSNIKSNNEIKQLIQNDKATLVRRDTNTRTVWELPLPPILATLNPCSKVRKITVVLDTKRKVLITAGEILKTDESSRISRNKIRKRITLEDIGYGEIE